MEDSEKTKYRLYALSVGRKSVERAAGERFARVTPYYVLIYTTDEPPKGAIELSVDDIDRLSSDDNRWLFDCNIAILAEMSEKRRPEVMQSLSERIERLEQELARKKQELENKER